jgi:lipoprotein-anchoring transpeptidase ErfK/SrfK
MHTRPTSRPQPPRSSPTVPVRARGDSARATGTLRIQAPRAPERQPRQILSASQRMRAVQIPRSHQQLHTAAPPRPRAQPARRPGQQRGSSSLLGLSGKNWLVVILLGVASLGAFTCLALTLGVGVIFGSGVLPGVHAAGVDLGGLSPEEAEGVLRAEWATITLRDRDRTWQIDREALGIRFDAAATARRAYRQGREDGDLLPALLGSVHLPPVVEIDREMLRASLETMADRLEIAPVNAGVELVDGQVRATPPQDGRGLELEATLARLNGSAADELADGALDLVMVTLAPAVTDSAPMIAAAEQILGNPLTLRAHDPVTGDSVIWELMPEVWARWLTAIPAAGSATGLALWLEEGPVRAYLTEQASIFDSTRYIDIDEAVAAAQGAVAQGQTRATLRVYHHDRQHVVRAGESIVSIAWDYGVPYPWLQQANPGVNSLSVGQTITIPSPDNFMPYPVVPDKRIVVSISEQRTRVYENGALLWDWAASTGIRDSPTWPGIYQVISHEINAYAGNWNLWMPHFMGVYQPIPGADFTNGFHGFPTRGGGQLLWENSLGRRVTYGCILLSSGNARQLYEWAEQGVVVEIRP